jgi:hypothetical protein
VLGFSPLERRTRRDLAVGLGAVLVAAAGLVRVRGVTGDFVPVLEWRWSRQAALPAPAPDAIADREPDVAAAGSAAAIVAEDGGVTARDTAATPDAPPSELEGRSPESAVATAPSAIEPAADSRDVHEVAVTGATYPQFLGPDRNGMVRGVRLSADWTTPRRPRMVRICRC